MNSYSNYYNSCEGLLLIERKEFEKQLADLRLEAKNREKRMKTENKRMRDERSSDEAAFKEILDQQEVSKEIISISMRIVRGLYGECVAIIW
jgi:hypothetical protein